MRGIVQPAFLRTGLIVVVSLTLAMAIPFVVRAAATPTGAPIVGQGEFQRHGGGLAAALIRATVDLTGLTNQQVLDALRAGRSLAQIAAANGSSGDAVVQAVVTKVKERLDRLVAEGRLTQAQADQRLADVKTRATELVNDTTLGQRIGTRMEDRNERAVMGMLVEAASTVTGLTTSDIVARLRAGESLEQIVRSAGANPTTVIDTATSSFRTAAERAMTVIR